MPKIIDSWYSEEDGPVCNISPIIMLNVLQSMGASKQRVKSLKSRADLCKSISLALSIKCLKGWKFLSYLGSGSNGTVFSIKNKKGKIRAAKIVTINPGSEVRVQKRLAKLSIAPKVYSSCKLADRTWVVVMEKIDGSLGDLIGGNKSLSKRMLKLIYGEIIRTVETMEADNISHGDLSLENLGYVVLPDKSIRVVIIDFGWSGRYVKMFDMISLMQALLYTKNTENRDFLYERFAKYIKKRYKFKMPMNIIGMDTLFRDFQKKFIDDLRSSL